MEHNLTTGSVPKTILLFSLPYFLSYFLQTLYGIQAILAEVPTDRGTVRSLIVTEDME